MERAVRFIVCIAVWSIAGLMGDHARAQDWARDMFDHTSHDFGTVARGAKVDHRFGVENIYLEDAHIESARASCGCTSPEVPTQILKTWKKAYLIAHVDTVNFQGQKDVTITVKFDRPFPAEVQLHIHCYIRTDVVLEPGSVRLNAAQGHSAEQHVSVRYAGRPDWQIQAVECANPNVSGAVTEVSRGNGSVEYDLAVKTAVTAKVGYSRDELNLVTNDPNPRALRVPLIVESLVVAPIAVHPSPLIMDPLPAGKLESPVMRPLVVISSSPFQITSAASSDPRFRCEVASEPANTMHRLPVFFLGGDAAGKITTRIRIQTTATAEPMDAEVTINLTPPAGGTAENNSAPAADPVAGKPAASKLEGSGNESQVDPVFGPPGTSARHEAPVLQDF